MNCQLKAKLAIGYLGDQRLESMFLVDHLKNSVSFRTAEEPISAQIGVTETHAIK